MQHTGTTDRDTALRRGLRVIVADDDTFTAALLADGLRGEGFEVMSAHSTEEAWTLATETDPHAVISELTFGSGDSGAALLRRIHSAYPWVGLVVLTSHQSPEIAVADADQLPSGSIYLVKSRLQSVGAIAAAISDAISGQSQSTPAKSADERPGSIVLTRAQADVLRMLANGASTKAIAESRGTTVRAAETLLARLYAALDLETGDQSNPRVAAAQLWQRGRITVR